MPTNGLRPLSSIIADICRPLPRSALSYASLVAAQIRRSLLEGDEHMIHEARGLKVDQAQSNGAWCVHQMRVTLPDGMGTYRVIVAPANAPIFIGTCPIDAHFNEPLLDAPQVTPLVPAAAQPDTARTPAGIERTHSDDRAAPGSDEDRARRSAQGCPAVSAPATT